MGKTTVGQQAVAGTEPEMGNKIDIRQTMGNRSEDHSPLAKGLPRYAFAYAGTDDYVGKRIQNLANL